MESTALTFSYFDHNLNSMNALWSMVCALLAGSAAGQAAAPTPAEFYERGMLEEAADALRAGAPAEPMLACRLALYANRNVAARECLLEILRQKPGDRTAAAVLAEAEYRSGKFLAAADAFEIAGRNGHAQRLRHFGATGPYRFRNGRTYSIRFVRLDPLPVLAVRVSDGPPLNFIIDTGAGDTIIDPTVAQAAKARIFGEQSGIFAGGATAVVSTAAVERLQLGTLTVGNVPVTILDTSRFSETFGGLPIAGVIGTGLLTNFTATIDYPNEKLILRPRGKGTRQQSGVSLPMWLLGDHYVLVDSSINGQRHLAFVDTGLAGLGCTLPTSSFKQLEVVAGASVQGGVGGGGEVGNVTPFRADIALGPVRQRNVECIHGPFPTQLEKLGGTRIGLLVSHAFFRPYAVTFDFDRMRLILGRRRSQS